LALALESSVTNAVGGASLHISTAPKLGQQKAQATQATPTHDAARLIRKIGKLGSYTVLVVVGHLDKSCLALKGHRHGAGHSSAPNHLHLDLQLIAAADWRRIVRP